MSLALHSVLMLLMRSPQFGNKQYVCRGGGKISLFYFIVFGLSYLITRLQPRSAMCMPHVTHALVVGFEFLAFVARVVGLL